MERIIDMSFEEQQEWESEQMKKSIDLDAENVHIDPSPFQLVERTSILKVHSLFSMLGINHAYVTNTGRLVGVVALKEVILFIILYSSGGQMCANNPKVLGLQLLRMHWNNTRHSCLN